MNKYLILATTLSFAFLATGCPKNNSSGGSSALDAPSFAGDSELTMGDLAGTWTSSCSGQSQDGSSTSMAIALQFTSGGELTESYTLYVNTANCTGPDFVQVVFPVVTVSVTGMDATYTGATDIYASAMASGTGTVTPETATAAAFMNSAQFDCLTNWQAGVQVNPPASGSCVINGAQVSFTNPSQATFTPSSEPVGMSGGLLYILMSPVGASSPQWLGLSP